MSDDPTDDKKSLYSELRDFFGKKAEEADEADGESDTDEQTTESAGQKGTDDEPEADADQKQDPDAEDVEDDLIAALAEHKDVDPSELRAALDNLGQSADDVPPEEDDDEEDDEDVGQDADDDAETTEVSIDFGAKAEEHGLVDEDTLDQKMDELRDDLLDDFGQKLAEENEEAVAEIAQKMQSGATPSPAGGSFQDAQDFESQIQEAADGEGW